MVNNSHRQSFLSPGESDLNIFSALGSSRPNTAPGHHLRMVRTLSQQSHQAEELPSLKNSPAPLTRALSGFKSTSTGGSKKNKFSKSQSRSEADLKDRQVKIVPHFGNRRIASCLIKLAQARLLISDEVPEHLEYHSAALHDAELV
jgi:hypothetical protein